MTCCYQEYEGCHIKGIPIGVPFKSRFFIPKSKRSEIDNDVDFFVLLRLNTRWLDNELEHILDNDRNTATHQHKQPGYEQNNFKDEEYQAMSKSTDEKIRNCRQEDNSTLSIEKLDEREIEKVNGVIIEPKEAKNDAVSSMISLFDADILRLLKGLQVVDLCKTVCTRRDKEKLHNEETLQTQRKRPNSSLETNLSSPSKLQKVNKLETEQGERTRLSRGRASKSRHKVIKEQQLVDADLTSKSKHTNESKAQEKVTDIVDRSQINEESEDKHDGSLTVSNSDVLPTDKNLMATSSDVGYTENKTHAKDDSQKSKKRKHRGQDSLSASESNKTIDAGEQVNIARESFEGKIQNVELELNSSGDVVTQESVSNEDFKQTEVNTEHSDKNTPKKPKCKDVKKKKKVIKESAGEETDPDLQGLSIKEKLLVMRQRKKIEKESKRIKVKLQDHPDKYRIDIMDSFARKDRGKSRNESATEIFVCTVCEKFKAKSMDSMESHIESHVNGKLNCDQCQYIAPFINDLIRHKREVHKKNINICFECGVETNGPDGLRDHLGKVHGKPQYKCKFCLNEKGEHFAETTKHSYRQHIRQVHPEQMSACQTCSRLFANATMLKRHLDLGCAGNMPSYACEKCGKTYNSQERVNDHVRRVHNKVRRFQCPHCPFTAARGAGLNQHLHIHTGYHPFKCDQCTFTCVQKYQLTSHMRTHNGIKPYKCTQCNFAAAWNVQLKDHMKVHGMINTVVCDLCNILFKDMRTYKTHVSKEHAETQPTITETLEIHQPIIQPYETQQVLLQPLETVNFVTQQTYNPLTLQNHTQFLQTLE